MLQSFKNSSYNVKKFKFMELKFRHFAREYVYLRKRINNISSFSLHCPLMDINCDYLSSLYSAKLNYIKKAILKYEVIFCIIYKN